MRLTTRSLGSPVKIVLLAWIAAGCSSAPSPAGGSPSGGGGAPPPSGGAQGTGGASSGGTRGTGGAGGTGAGGGSGGMTVTPEADSGAAPDTSSGPTPDATGTTPDTDSFGDGGTPMGTDGGPQPSYEGEIPIYYGPEVGPLVKMQCPEDPTQGWTEYQDGFHLERPYDVPINTRFSITGGIYNFWVFPGDKPHSTIAMGRNPRTEATYGGIFDKATVGTVKGVSAHIGYFTSGQRMYSADMLIEGNAVGSAIVQIHTTAAGGGPIGIRVNGGNMVNNGSLTVVQGSTVTGGLVNNWFNYKSSLDTATLEVKIYINNCLKSTYKGDRGDGHFYFKNGVYFCKSSPKGCFSHYKNIHLYKK